MQKAIILGIVVVLTGCTRAHLAKNKPEEVVRQFVEMSAKASESSDRKKLQKLTSGEMRRTFERMTEEMFELSYLKNRVTIEDLKMLDIETKESRAKVVYQIKIKNDGGTEPTLETSEREVELVLNDGEWQLEHIRPRGEDKIAFTRGMIF